MTRGGKTYYYHTNYRGDVVALTDSAGAVVATYEYDAYGNLLKETGTVENPYRYAGYRYDGETGLYYLQSRYYNPETGRFLTRDNFEGFENEPLSLNKYSYVHNNPILFVDPSGNYAVVVYAIPGVGQVAMVVTIGVVLGYGAYYLYTRSGPIKKPNRKKQGREVNEGKRQKKGWKSNPNKKVNRAMKKHTPSKNHRKIKKKKKK